MEDVSLTSLEIGLTESAASALPKNIPPHRLSGIEFAFITLKNQIVSFFFALLVISGALSFFLHEPVDASIFFAIAGINVILGFIQEYRAGKSAEALESLVKHTVTVRREGVLKTIESDEVALGDILLCEPGDIIVADLIIRESKDLLVDESVLTGETMPLVKKDGETLSSGVSIVQGTCIAQVIKVGKDSSLLLYANKISHVRKNSSFEKFITRLSRLILILTVACLAIVLVANVFITHAMPISEYVLYAVAMLVGVVPESLPLIITIILTREALMLVRRNVIVKRLAALENLGSMNFLFTDKTGTITENKLKVVNAIDEGTLTECLSCISGGEYERTPMDTVFDTAIASYLDDLKIEKSTAANLVLSPFQITRGYSIYTLPDGSEVIRGQYAMVSPACDGNHTRFLDACIATEQQGLRVIAFAHKKKGALLYTLSGAVVFEDPLKPDAKETYQTLKDLGINVKVITGDSALVATYVGHVLDSSCTDKNVCSMDSWQSSKNNIEAFTMYARCSPDQKSILIDEHLDHGVVGFLGEGINDAMALKRADVGFVVSNASDVARQSGDILLLEKSLAPIVEAITLSRKAFLHIRTYLLCTLTGNLGTLISLTAVSVWLQNIPMLPIQILLNNLLTDLPLMFLIADQVDKNSLRRPIRDESRRFFFIIFVFATISSLFDFTFFFLFKQYDIAVLRTGWFVFSVVAELTLVFSLRSELSIFKSPAPSKILGGILAACYILAFALPFLPFASVFHLLPLTVLQIAIIVGVTIVYFAMNEVMKRILFKK